MGNFLLHLILSCVAVAVAVGTTHLLGIELPDTVAGAKWVFYIGVVFVIAMRMHKLDMEDR